MPQEPGEPLLAESQGLLGTPPPEHDGGLVRADADQEPLRFGGESRPGRAEDEGAELAVGAQG